MLRRSLLLLSLIVTPLAIATGSPELAFAAPPEAVSAAVISGVVKDTRTDLPIENAVVVLQCTCLSAQQERMTNARGIYSFQDLPAGNYTIQALAGKANVSKIVQLPRGAKFRANFGVDPTVDEVIEIVVDAAPVPANVATTMTLDMEAAKQLPVGSNTSRDFTAVVDLSPTASRDSAGISLAGTTGASSSPGSDQGWSAGTLTAGTLDDNRTRELSAFAQTAQQCTELSQRVGLGPRTELVIVDSLGQPIQDAHLRVTASPSNRSVWLRTGTDGRAVINGGLDVDDQAESVEVIVLADGVDVTRRITLGRGRRTIDVPIQQTAAATQVRGLDLVVVVDATGSMADELEWLKVELRSVVERAVAEHPNVDVRLGVVSYRDVGDVYVTRTLDLTSDHDVFERFLARQSADGGGDMPEAVDAALEEAASFAWRNDQQIAKVVLLVGDAEPHDDRNDATFRAVTDLRATGVSIYPIASSGVGDQAELIFRAIAADTGAQYLFLTDDSGIGNPHAKPHADDYDVELLEDALARILDSELTGGQPSSRAEKQRARSYEHKRKSAAFRLQRSLLDDAGAHELLGGPMVTFGLI